MLVSAWADDRLRADVKEGRRPCPEFLRLESFGVQLLDWSRLKLPRGSRSVVRSLRHLAAAYRHLPNRGAIFSDGEHLGIPLGILLRARRTRVAHVVIGHHLTTGRKRPFFRILHADRGMSRVLLHSRRQMHHAETDLRIPMRKLHLVPYFVDTTFWQPGTGADDRLIVSAGAEHRDFTTLARASDGLDVPVAIALGSVHSPGALRHQPAGWPSQFQVSFNDYAQLRDLYRRARLVVVPIIETDFQAGITTVLEAMAMGKAIITTATAGRTEVIVDGETGILVPPGDTLALRAAIQRLLSDPQERKRLGENARAAAESSYGLDRYAGRLYQHLVDAEPIGGAAG